METGRGLPYICSVKNNSMKKPLLLILTAVTTIAATAQNLVNNPSFEDTIMCPNFVSQIDYATGWSTTNFTPDYYNACNNNGSINPGMVGVPNNARGYQPARTGNAYAGIVTYYTAQTNYREVFQSQLLQPLQPGVTYQVGMWIVLNEDNAQLAVDGGIGIYISNSPINTSQLFSYVPQIMNPNGNVLNDSLNWTLISGLYTATGGETYITIGGFIPDNALTIINRGGTYPFTSYAIEDVYVQQNLSTGMTEDLGSLINVYPNPATDNVNISFAHAGTGKVLIELYNSIGEMVYSSLEDNYSGKGISIPLAHLASGVYSLAILTNGTRCVKKIIKE